MKKCILNCLNCHECAWNYNQAPTETSDNYFYCSVPYVVQAGTDVYADYYNFMSLFDSLWFDNFAGKHAIFVFAEISS